MDIIGRVGHVRDLSSLPVEEDDLGGALEVRFSSLKEFALLLGHLGQEVVFIFPGGEFVESLDGLLTDLLQERTYVDLRVEQLLRPDHPLQHHLCVVLALVVVHHPRTVDQVNPFGEVHILPDLGLSRDRSCLAHLLLLERVDDAALAHIRIADETDRNVLLVLMEVVELSQEVDETALAETVLHTGMVGHSGTLFLQMGHPTLGKPGRHQIDFIQDQDQVLMGQIAFEMFFDVLASGA